MRTHLSLVSLLFVTDSMAHMLVHNCYSTTVLVKCSAMVWFITFFVLPRWWRGWANITPSAVTKLMIPAERERERGRKGTGVRGRDSNHD